METLSYLYIISAPLQPGKTSMLHLMQDLLHGCINLHETGWLSSDAFITLSIWKNYLNS